MRKLPLWVGHVVAAVGSLGIAFFAVFNVLFSDIFKISVKVEAVLYVLVIYFIWSLLLHWVWPGRKAWRWWLLTPALLFAISVAAQDRARYGYIFSVVVGVVVGTTLGWLISRRRQKPV